MSVQPRDPRLLTSTDVDGRPFHCCGNQELLFLKCPTCGHLMVFCLECDTLFGDLERPEHSAAVALTRKEQRVVCPACSVAFDDYYFLMPPHVDKYLPTAADVIARGYGHLLSPARRLACGLT